MSTRTLMFTATLAWLATLPAMAAPVDVTGTGAGPASAAKAPYTASTGATVPRPGRTDATETGSIERRTKREAAEDKIMRGICIGCSAR